MLFAPSRWLDAQVRQGAPKTVFRLAWPTPSGWSEPAHAVAVDQSPQPPVLASLPEPLAAGEFVPGLQQQKLLPGPQRILFAGDSMMQGVAPLVIRALSAQHPDWDMLDLSRQSTGLTVRKYFDWPGRIQEEIEARNLSLVVVFLGPNDPADMLVDGQRHGFPSPGWAFNYALRVDEILSAAAQRQVRVIWLGLPSMREGRIREGAALQNRIFQARAKTWGMDYLATEPLIGKLSEPFQKFIIDEAGHALNLRAEDGIHMTPAGHSAMKRLSLLRRGAVLLCLWLLVAGWAMTVAQAQSMPPVQSRAALTSLRVQTSAHAPDLQCTPARPKPRVDKPVDADPPEVPDDEAVQSQVRDFRLNADVPVGLPGATRSTARLWRPDQPADALRVGIWGDSHLAAGFFTSELVRLSQLPADQVSSRFVPANMNRPGVRLPLRKSCVSPHWQY
eukprot:gene44348-55153_t